MTQLKHSALICDGCGQLAQPAHIAHRLERLEWTTRFRPVHIQTLLLSGIAPASDDDFLYAPESKLSGEAAAILELLEISAVGKPLELILTETQKRGILLTHAMECPLEPGTTAAGRESLLVSRGQP